MDTRIFCYECSLCMQKICEKWSRGERYEPYTPWNRVFTPLVLSRTES